MFSETQLISMAQSYIPSPIPENESRIPGIRPYNWYIKIGDRSVGYVSIDQDKSVNTTHFFVGIFPGVEIITDNDFMKIVYYFLMKVFFTRRIMIQVTTPESFSTDVMALFNRNNGYTLFLHPYKFTRVFSKNIFQIG